MKNKIIEKFHSLPSFPKAPANDDKSEGESPFKYLAASSQLDNGEEISELTKAIKPISKWGIIITTFVIGFFILWAGFAPLDSASIATGSVVLHENRKTIQHLEGGIISGILVKEGDFVTQGQPLINLNATSATAQQQLLLGQLRAALATEARLVAERDNKEEVDFSSMPLAQDNQNNDEITSSQKKLFETRRSAITGQVGILQERIKQYNEQVQGLSQQAGEITKQSNLIKEEVKTVAHLLEKGLEQKPRLLALQRRQSELKGESARLLSETATISGSISEVQLQIINVQNEYLKEVMTELKDVQQVVADLREKLLASGDILERTVITAPQSGKITGLQFHTIGGVISPGATIMEIVPQNDKLIVEARVKPEDIDIVKEGLDAKVMLSAYKSRSVPRLEGKVTYLSADRFKDEQTGMYYYLAKIEINEDEIANLSTDVELYPGMPTESFIKTGESTFLNYLASPIIDSFRRSFKEQ
jgi:HlyD family type I secretion membrane fusion protein